MKILAIETSCDETAIAVVEAEGNALNARFRVLGNALLSQIDAHREYGGVFPALAKREHAKNLVPILEAALEEAELLREDTQEIEAETRDKIAAILSREGALAEQFFAFVTETEPPDIDVIAVTAGPGLEPALWVGVNFAKALALAWSKPIVAINHMEGHVLAALAQTESRVMSQESRKILSVKDVELPVLALLISGGHTELVLMKEWLAYELLGQTRDDAVGEAYDKVARMMGLPYPGGHAISALAEMARKNAERTRNDAESSPRVPARNPEPEFRLPRPMMNDGTCDFSFAGLKTAVLYLLKDYSHFPQQNENENASNAPGSAHANGIPKSVRPDNFWDSDGEEMKKHIACEFENAVADVLWKKTSRALADSGARTLVIGGGVSANTHIRRVFAEKIANFADTKCRQSCATQGVARVELRIPPPSLSTDNAIMIALAGFYRALRKEFADPAALSANGNLPLAARVR